MLTFWSAVNEVIDRVGEQPDQASHHAAPEIARHRDLPRAAGQLHHQGRGTRGRV